MSMHWTEDDIAAWVDGELEPEAARRIGAIVVSDPEARVAAQRVEATNRALRAAFADTLAAPVPAALTAAVLAEPGKVAMLTRPARRVVWGPAALAASVALAVGVGLGALVPGSGGPAGVAVAVGPAGPLVAAALEGSPGGAEAPGGLRPLASFRIADGRICREFETAEAAVGLACRGEAGWTVALMAAPPEPAAARGGYVTAGAVFADAVGAALDALDAGPALSPDEEAAAIAAGWR